MSREVGARAGDLRVGTYNLRFAEETGEHAWSRRAPVMVQQLRRLAIDVLGTQEGLDAQLQELTAALGCRRVGQGRLGGADGEHTAVLYDPRRVELVTSGDLWLSLAPHVPGSRHPDARLPRMLTWARLRVPAVGSELLVVNVHLSHVSSSARRHGVEMVVDLLDAPGRPPTVVLGDFNDDAAGELASDLADAAGLQDAAAVAYERVGEQWGTFTGFGPPLPGPRIDWLLVDGRLEVLHWEAVLPPAGPVAPSDHLPVVASLRLRDDA